MMEQRISQVNELVYRHTFNGYLHWQCIPIVVVIGNKPFMYISYLLYRTYLTK